MTDSTKAVSSARRARGSSASSTKSLQTEPASLYEQMKQDLITGAFPPGAALVETLLAERYRVSRTPIREALVLLAQEGLVERFGRSMRVRNFTVDQIHELYEVRSILEGAAARIAASRRTTLDVAALQVLLERLEAPDVEIPDRIRLNRAFHAALWKASHNSMLVDALERVYVNSIAHMQTTLVENKRWMTALEQHRAIFAALEEGNADAAEAVTLAHLRISRDIRVRALDHA